MSEHMAALRASGPLKDAPLHQAALRRKPAAPPTGATRRREKRNPVRPGSLDGLPPPKSWPTLDHPQAMTELPIPLSQNSAPLSPRSHGSENGRWRVMHTPPNPVKLSHSHRPGSHLVQWVSL